MIKIRKSITAREIVLALEKDGFYLHHQRGSHRTYKKGNLRVDVPYHHAGQTFPIKTLLCMIKDTGWTEDDLRRLKLIK
jgi:predicted RNA binding protein YcfA (HicA-like mRNA interferase family)